MKSPPRFAPQSGFGGLTPFAGPNTAFGFAAPRFSLPYRTGFGYGYGGYGYAYNGYGYGSGGYRYNYGGYGPVFVPHWRWVQPQVVLANEFPATLTIQLPAGDAPKEYALMSPVLKPGEEYTFAVDVRWMSGGKTYEAKRSVTLGPGARSRLLIVSGEEVKE